MDKSNEKKCHQRISENFETQVQLLETLSHIQTLTLSGIAADDGGEMPRQQAENIACMFSLIRVMIMRKEIGFYLTETV